MTSRIKISFLFFLFLAQFSFSQKPDSLKKLLSVVADTTKCKIYNALIEGEPNDSIWPLYNAELVKHCENKLKTCPPELRNYYSQYYAMGLNNFGFMHMDLGNSVEALDYYKKALTIQESIKDKGGAAATLVNIGYTFRRGGNINKAIENYHSALKMYTELRDTIGIATCYNNIGYVFDGQNQFAKALEYYQKALDAYTKIKDDAGMALSYGNIAYMYKTYGDPDCKKSKDICTKRGAVKAIRYLLRAIQIQKEMNDKDVLAGSYNILGGIYVRFGDPECVGSEKECETGAKQKALSYFDLALKLRTETGNAVGIASSYHSLADYMYRNNDHKKALEYGLKEMEVSEKLNSPEYIGGAAELLKNIYEKMNRPADALKMYELYIQMKDSVHNEETINAAIKKTFQIEYEKKAAADSVLVAEEKKVAAAQLEEEKTKRFALYGGLAFAIIFAIFMVNRFLVIRKQNKIIENKEREALLQNIIISEQKHIVEEKQKEVLDSIHYAKRIQSALIANTKFIDENLPANFVYFDPKDIVSGDFYWAALHNSKFYFAVCDSTGHGVPGAFMSLLNMGFLSEAIKEKNIEKPNEIFDYVRERLVNSISSEGQKDGMDGILLCYDKKNNTFEYCAANNEPILIRDHKIIELDKDKMPVGKGERTDKFTLQKLELQKGDILYMYTDGFADQFGGPKGKKFMYKRLNELLLQTKDLPITEQKDALAKIFKEWKGNLEQVDDVLIAGIKI
jgi:serine phosphatase RsbU (regulator of sigma subunit)/Tfp pilus assembly protein PilF